MRGPSTLLRDRRGSVAIEFSLIAVPFLALMFGIMEYGRLLWTRNAMSETAIMGARCAGLLQSQCASNGTLSTSAAKSYMVALASGWAIELQTSEIAITTATTCGGTSGFVTVSITHTFSPVLTAIIGLEKTMTLTETSCFPASS